VVVVVAQARNATSRPRLRQSTVTLTPSALRLADARHPPVLRSGLRRPHRVGRPDRGSDLRALSGGRPRRSRSSPRAISARSRSPSDAESAHVASRTAISMRTAACAAVGDGDPVEIARAGRSRWRNGLGVAGVSRFISNVNPPPGALIATARANGSFQSVGVIGSPSGRRSQTISARPRTQLTDCSSALQNDLAVARRL
jgi:hypothetical protein